MATLLDAVNDIISSVGESPLAVLDNSHPLEQSALAVLNRINKRVQSKGYWFNTASAVDLPLDLNSKVPVAANLLSVETTDRASGVVVRGGFLYNLIDATDVFTDPVRCNVRVLIDFEDLPETAAQYIQAEAVLQFFKNYDGDGTKIQALAGDVTITKIAFSADHIRNSDVNLYASGETGYNLTQIRGQRYSINNN